jgi:DNA ligase 1
MNRFAALFATLDSTTATNAKVDAIARYLTGVPADDAAWAVFFLSGRRLLRLLPSRALRSIIAATGVNDWLAGECYSVVGDAAETAALIFDRIPATPAPGLALTAWVEERILPLRHALPERQQHQVLAWIRELGRWERFTLLKLLTGEFRAGVSQTLVVRAIAQAATLPPTTVAARMAGDWAPTADWYRSLVTASASDADRSRPYPFFLASPIDHAVTSAADLEQLLGDRHGWQVEWKWDGIRSQLVKRGGGVFLWSRGEETIGERFPEIVDAASTLGDGVVLDGEILAFRDDQPLPFSALQQRIGRLRQVDRKARAVPVVFMAYDILEEGGADVRQRPLAVRRALLEDVLARAMQGARTPAATGESLLPFGDNVPAAGSPAVSNFVLRGSPTLESETWDALADWRSGSRSRGVEGLMIKRLTSAYGVGRKRGDWWKWKITPHTIDAVLIYAQPGSGKRASLLTDYTFGLWHGDELVPVAKAYSGLTNDEITEMDRWIRRHTAQRFGPVRHVDPVHVFELGFEAVARSSRHRSGVAVRFPRMLRWRKDKIARDADTLETLLAMIADR